MTLSTLSATTLRPGYLVAVKTAMSGNVSYIKTDLELTRSDEGSVKKKWETVRTTADQEEHDTAVRVRSKARAMIMKVCAITAFGYLCPGDKRTELDGAILEAREMVSEFNVGAACTRVYFNVLAGRIEPNDAEAVKAINGEVRDLMAEMEQGVKNLDVEKIRDAASRARSLGKMLTPEAEARLKESIDAVRKTARKIVAAGEAAGIEVDQQTLVTLKQSRVAFLDLDGADDVAAPQVATRAVDFEPAAA